MNSSWIILEISLIDHCDYPSHYQWHSIRFDSRSGILCGFTKWSSTLCNWQVNCWVLWWWHRFKRVIISGFSHYSGEHFIERTSPSRTRVLSSFKSKMVISISNTVSVLFPLHHNIIEKHVDLPFNQQKHTFAKLKYFTALQQLK